MNVIKRIFYKQTTAEDKIILTSAGACLFSFAIGFLSYSPIIDLLKERWDEQEQIAEQDAIQVENHIMDEGDYTGGLYRGKRHGWGKLRTKKGTQYEGEWVENELPEGTMISEYGLYNGRFNKSLYPHGWGVMEYNDSIYAGNWYGGNKNGYGRVIYPDGSSVVAMWNKGKKEKGKTPYRCRKEIIYGIDVSKWQEKMDWNNLVIFTDKNGTAYSRDPEDDAFMAPVTFAYIKATESASKVDPTYYNHYQQAKRHLVSRGSYHFFSMLSSAREQAENFLSNSLYESGDLPPMLDVEVKNQLGKGKKLAPSVKKMRDSMLEWLSIVENKLGVRPIIYTSDKFYTDFIKPDSRFWIYGVWIARYYNVKPRNEEWVLWQMTDQARLPGMKGSEHIDIDLFDGNIEDFNSCFGLNNIFVARKERSNMTNGNTTVE